eukprot:CAMPEP_0117891948 /NCGR_PEP_ID=MMETSP0950-20121206/24294_1 /TAXON_ID=44440 /ORGANISM="Chattonella subsalsa, Strain CCMP2191" /LENGTH=66 /DNA_ID=CAMNT_0005751633 /DNA_START=486 /DNA_END=683 /DNA_ORIENTATION=+
MTSVVKVMDFFLLVLASFKKLQAVLRWDHLIKLSMKQQYWACYIGHFFKIFPSILQQESKFPNYSF